MVVFVQAALNHSNPFPSDSFRVLRRHSMPTTRLQAGESPKQVSILSSYQLTKRISS